MFKRFLDVFGRIADALETSNALYSKWITWNKEMREEDLMRALEMRVADLKLSALKHEEESERNERAVTIQADWVTWNKMLAAKAQEQQAEFQELLKQQLFGAYTELGESAKTSMDEDHFIALLGSATVRRALSNAVGDQMNKEMRQAAPRSIRSIRSEQREPGNEA